MGGLSGPSRRKYLLTSLNSKEVEMSLRRVVRWSVVLMKRVTIVEGRDLGNYNLDKET